MSAELNEHNPLTHRVMEGSQLRLVEELPCNCGAAEGAFHTRHRENPTGHSVGCPVFLRWEAVRCACVYASALARIERTHDPEPRYVGSSPNEEAARCLNVNGRAWVV